MSARSRDLITATLISAGIPAAGELYMAAGTTGAFESYWKDWFDNDRFFTGTTADATGCIQKTYTAMTAGRNDVMLVGPGTHDISTALSWAKTDTHMVGAVGHNTSRPSARIQPHGAVSPLITVASSGCVFSGVTLRNGQSTGSTACLITLQISSGARGFALNNSFVWGPEDDVVNDATGSWCLIYVLGSAQFYNNRIGYGYPVTDGGTGSTKNSLVRYVKSKFNETHWKDCTFLAEFKDANSAFIWQEYSPAATVYHTFRNCVFINTGSTATAQGIKTDQSVISAGQNFWYFDANCAFVGVTDVSAANNETYIRFSPAMAQSTDAAHVQVGLGLGFDHTS